MSEPELVEQIARVIYAHWPDIYSYPRMTTQTRQDGAAVYEHARGEDSWEEIQEMRPSRAEECREAARAVLSSLPMREQTEELERLRRVEEDHKNVLKAALYNEPDGVDLVKRLTTYAVEQRAAVEAP